MLVWCGYTAAQGAFSPMESERDSRRVYRWFCPSNSGTLVMLAVVAQSGEIVAQHVAILRHPVEAADHIVQLGLIITVRVPIHGMRSDST